MLQYTQANEGLLFGELAPNHAIPSMYQSLVGKKTALTVTKKLKMFKNVSDSIALTAEDTGSNT